MSRRSHPAFVWSYPSLLITQPEVMTSRRLRISEPDFTTPLFDTGVDVLAAARREPRGVVLVGHYGVVHIGTAHRRLTNSDHISWLEGFRLVSGRRRRRERDRDRGSSLLLRCGSASTGPRQPLAGHSLHLSSDNAMMQCGMANPYTAVSASAAYSSNTSGRSSRLRCHCFAASQPSG